MSTVRVAPSAQSSRRRLVSEGIGKLEIFQPPIIGDLAKFRSAFQAENEILMDAATITPTQDSIQTSHRAYELPTGDFQDLLAAPPIDRDRLLDQCLGNLDFALMLLDEFAKTSPSRLEGFDAALAERNHATIATKAHALRGTAGILAANALMETCANLESSAKQDADWNLTHNLVQQLHHEIQRAIDFIPVIRATA